MTIIKHYEVRRERFPDSTRSPQLHTRQPVDQLWPTRASERQVQYTLPRRGESALGNQALELSLIYVMPDQMDVG